MNSLYDNLFVDVVWHANLLNSTTLEQSAYVDMSDKHRVMFVCEQQGTSSQDIENLRLVQATNSSGTGKKNLTNDTTIADSALIDAAAGQKFIMECEASDLDIENDFDHVAVEAAASTTSSDLFLTVVAIAIPRYASENLNVTTPSTDIVHAQ